MTKNIVITITRQYGSGGRAIGEQVAKSLGIDYYDKDLITLAAQKIGMHPEVLHEVDEKATNSLLYTLAMGSSVIHHPTGMTYDMPINDKLFVIQSDVIRELADKGPCVIVGRCADYVLRDRKGCLSVFVDADLEWRIEHVAHRNQISQKEARELILKTDKRRNNYYSYYTGQKWGRTENYDLMVNTAHMGIDKTAQLIQKYAELYMEA